MDTRYDHAYPPSDWTIDELAETFADASRSASIPVYADTAIWAALRDDPVAGPKVEGIISEAEEVSGSQYEHQTVRNIVNHEGGDDRDGFNPRRHADRVWAFALAECFERDGEYLDDILEHVWGICDLATWVGGFHLDGIPSIPDDQIDLSVAMLSKDLAELEYVLGDRMHPKLGKRIRYEIDRRVLTPYLERDDYWWNDPPANNWNTVCNGGVLMSALYVEDEPERLASIVKKGVDNIRHYFAGIDHDGCVPEGVTYWNYGMENFVQLAVQLEHHTDGQYSLFSVPVVEEIAQFSRRVELSQNRYPQFSDAYVEQYDLTAYLCCQLGNRYDDDWLTWKGRQLFAGADAGSYLPGQRLSYALRNLLWCWDVPDDGTRPTAPEAAFFAGHQWWVGRDDPADEDGLVVAAKGGHNSEPHNHNDCGSFVVHRNGESLLTDLGAPEYTDDFFGDARYDTFGARSLGHSVPYVNETEQASGQHADDSEEGDFHATVVDRTSVPGRETVAFDLAESYPKGAGLESLRRRLALDRGSPGQVTLTDRYEFEGPDNDVTSVFVSYFPIEATEAGFMVMGERGSATVTFDAAPGRIEVDHVDDAVRGREAWRARVIPPVHRDAERVTTHATIQLE